MFSQRALSLGVQLCLALKQKFFGNRTRSITAHWLSHQRALPFFTQNLFGKAFGLVFAKLQRWKLNWKFTNAQFVLSPVDEGKQLEEEVNEIDVDLSPVSPYDRYMKKFKTNPFLWYDYSTPPRSLGIKAEKGLHRSNDVTNVQE